MGERKKLREGISESDRVSWIGDASEDGELFPYAVGEALCFVRSTQCVRSYMVW